MRSRFRSSTTPTTTSTTRTSQNGPEPSAGLVLAGWFILTPLAIAGWVYFRRGDAATAGLLFMAYSFSGLVGLGHYTVGGMTDEPLWRQAHVVADILLGFAVFGFGLRAFLSARRESSGRSRAA